MPRENERLVQTSLGPIDYAGNLGNMEVRGVPPWQKGICSTSFKRFHYRVKFCATSGMSALMPSCLFLHVRRLWRFDAKWAVSAMPNEKIHTFTMNERRDSHPDTTEYCPMQLLMCIKRCTKSSNCRQTCSCTKTQRPKGSTFLSIEVFITT